MGIDYLSVQCVGAIVQPVATASIDWWAALAGLHPLVMHFPIALIVCAAVVEFIQMLARRDRLASFSVIALVVGGIGACIAAWSGWELAAQGHGSGWELDLHRWLGVSTAILGFGLAVCALLSWYGEKAWATVVVRAGSLLGAILIGVTAHFGGEMLWGNSLLFDSLFPEVAPAVEPEPEPVEEPVVFKTTIQPILEAKCWKCHGPTGRAKAGLRLTDESEMVRELDGHTIVKPGDVAGSQLVFVLELPRDDDLAMPPEDKPQLSEEEIASIKKWIADGASFAGAAPTATTEPTAPATAPDPEQVAADARSKAIADAQAKLTERGIPARQLSQDSPELGVNASALSHRIDPPFGDPDLALLAGLQPVLAELDLSNTAVTDSGIETLAGFDALQHVKLKDTRTGDGAAKTLAGLPALQVVNFFGSDLDDAGLKSLAAAPALRVIYAANSKVTEAGAKAVAAEKPDLVVHWQGAAAQLAQATAERAAAAAAEKTAELAAVGQAGGFKTSIEPILAANCFSCHGAEGDVKAGLRLATYEQVLGIRDDGKLVDPGKPDESLLFKRVSLARNAEGAMPPKGAGLSGEQVALIKAWISAGAK